ncbi:MAG: FAA hydrolase family protein [Myxococcales bacterium]|nr:FAA hydrolase family protein [Myxococcales bacterium]
MPWLFEPFPVAALPLSDSDCQFAVQRIWCVGRNYATHTREMGADPDRDPPFFFAKPASALVFAAAASAAQPTQVPYPVATADLHHEVEMVIALGQASDRHPDSDPLGWIAGLAVGIDLTRRDLQADLKTRSLPWEMAKAFDHSAIVGAIGRPPLAKFLASKPKVSLHVNDQQRQVGDIGEMIWPVADLLRHLAALVQLHPGDLVFTGTPAGVGPLQRGDRVHAEVVGLPRICFEINALL